MPEVLPDVKFSQGKEILVSAQDNFSSAFYDTGEHVLAGDALKLAAGLATLPVGKAKVSFTYPEIMAMADLYLTHADMMNASEQELRNIQQLIQRSKQFYGKKLGLYRQGAANPAGKDWMAATGGRYLDLAVNNFAHFAPSAKPQSIHPPKDNKAAWEQHHADAINQVRSGISMQEALIINAFGDHFLTDAFSSGHLFSREDVNQALLKQLKDGLSVKPAGVKFFRNLSGRLFADAALKQKFSGYKFQGKPFDTPEQLVKILEMITVFKPEILGGLIALGIHNKLNTVGVEVTNNKGFSPWMLTGDDHLDLANLRIMQQAVAQSVQNVLNTASNSVTPISQLQKKVWDFVPRPTGAGQKILDDVISKHTDPLSNEIVFSTEAILKSHLSEILAELYSKGILTK